MFNEKRKANRLNVEELRDQRGCTHFRGDSASVDRLYYTAMGQFDPEMKFICFFKLSKFLTLYRWILSIPNQRVRYLLEKRTSVFHEIVSESEVY